MSSTFHWKEIFVIGMPNGVDRLVNMDLLLCDPSSKSKQINMNSEIDVLIIGGGMHVSEKEPLLTVQLYLTLEARRHNYVNRLGLVTTALIPQRKTGKESII